MAEKFTNTRIETEMRDMLMVMAEADRRSPPFELRWLIEQELARRTALKVTAIQELPHPADAIPVPLVFVRKNGDNAESEV